MQPTSPTTASHGETNAKVFTGWTQPPTAQQEPATSNTPETLSPKLSSSVKVTV
jgi:hypothetical protein